MITGHLRVRYTFLMILCGLACLFGCNGQPEMQTDQAAEKSFPVEVTLPVLQDVAHTLEAVGSFLPEEEVTVGAEVAGTIKELHTDEGTLVTRGQPLLSIDDEKVRLEVQETEAMLREARARLKNAENTLNRMTKLFRDKVIGRHDFDDAETEVSLNKAMVEELQARLNRAKKSLRDARVRAPIDGTISERLVSPGEYVKVGAQLMRIVDADPLKLVFSLPEQHVGEARKGQKVSITTRAYPGKSFEGSVYFINPKIDQDTRTIEIKAWVDNSDHQLKPGFYVNVTVYLGSKKSLVLPESAVVVREGIIMCMAVENDRIVYKKVVPGVRFNGMVEVLDGITSTDRIVVYGRSEISEGTLVTVTSEKKSPGT